MSHYMTALAMKQEGLKPATKIVLYWLADHHNGETGLCIPSQKRLAELCEMTDRSIRTHLDTLQTLGLIKVIERKRDNGSQTSNEYKLLFSGKNLPTLMENISSPHVHNFPTHNLGINNLVNNNYTSSKDDEVNYYFDQLWEMYPRKVGKGQARKAFKAASKKIEFYDLLPKLMDYVETLNGKDKQYMPHLSTWLNGERWADEVDA